MAPVVMRGRGRPKGSKNKAKGASAPVPALKRGRGRPKGSKNRKTPDADLDAEPDVLVCPITRTMFRDPVMVFDSGHTYERSAILSHFEAQRGQGPAHASRPEQHEGDDELGGETDCSGLAGQAPGRDARRLGQSRASGAVEG